MRREVTGALMALGVMLLGALGFAFAFPSQSISIVVETARVHVGVGLVLVSAALMVCRAIKRGAVLLALGVSVFLPSAVASLAAIGTKPPEPAGALKVLDFNILNRNTDNGQRIANLIVTSGADVVFIQEAAPIEPFLAEIDAAYPHRVGCGNVIVQCDSMLLTKAPIDKVEVYTLGELFPNRTIVASLSRPDGPLWLVATHMTKPYFDFVGLSEMWGLRRIVDALEGPVVVAGDFNAGLHSGALARIIEGAGLRSAPIEPATWPVRAGAFGIPIDHVLARLPARVLQTTALPDSMGSNHRGLTSSIVVGGPPAL